MEAERQERREIGEEKRVANIATTEATGSPESSVQVVSSQTYGDAQKRKALSAISGNSVEKGIKKTKATEKKKGAESFINAFISQETRVQTEATKASINTEIANYIQEIETRIYRTYDEEWRKAMTTIQNAIEKLEKEHEETKDKVTGLKTQNKELLHTIEVQAEELKALYDGIRMPASNEAPQTAPRPVIIPATPIRLVGTPTHRNKEEIANRMMTAPRAPASYAQITTKNSSDLDKSQ